MSSTRKFDWQAIRAEYEAGASQSDLSRRHGCSRKAIQIRLGREGWTQDITDALNRLTAAKVAGVVAGCDPQKKAVALDRAAELKAAVVARHKYEWDQQKHLVAEAVESKDLTKAKLAKITAETLQICQNGERKAWGILEADVRPKEDIPVPSLNLTLNTNSTHE